MSGESPALSGSGVPSKRTPPRSPQAPGARAARQLPIYQGRLVSARTCLWLERFSSMDITVMPTLSRVELGSPGNAGNYHIGRLLVILHAKGAFLSSLFWG